MSFERFFQACMRVGLNRAEAEEQVRKAKEAGFMSDDPYLLPFIAEGLLLRAAKVNFIASKNFEALKQDYAEAVAAHISNSIVPAVFDTASTAFERTLHSPTRRAKHVLLIGAFCAIFGSCGFLAGTAPRLQVEGSLATLAQGENAAAWSEIIRLNSRLPENFARCRTDAKYQTRDSVGTRCSMAVYLSKLEQPAPSWSGLLRFQWLAWICLGAAIAGVVSLSGRPALCALNAIRVWVLAAFGAQTSSAEASAPIGPASLTEGER